MSTLAIDGASPARGDRRVVVRLRYLDLAALALALPVFVLAGYPILGYVVAAGAWLAQRAIQIVASRRATESERRGDRTRALSLLAGSTLARVWLVSLSILLVGLAEREAGLAAALLAAILFTLYLVTQVIVRLLEGEGSR